MPISAAMAMLFCVAVVATPVLVVHEAVDHVHGHHHHGDGVSGYGIGPAPHSHGEHEHSKLTEARVSMRDSHDDIGMVAHAGTTISQHTYYAATRVPARPAPGPPRNRDPLSRTTVLRI